MPDPELQLPERNLLDQRDGYRRRLFALGKILRAPKSSYTFMVYTLDTKMASLLLGRMYSWCSTSGRDYPPVVHGKIILRIE